MKTSLEHLPEKHQAEINHILGMIREVLHPEMVILFGSYAKGRQVNHRYTGGDGVLYEYISDYDFLVIVSKVTTEVRELEWVIEEKASIYETPVNLEIHEIEYINQGLEVGQYFFTDIIKEGVLLYDSQKVSFANARALDAKEKGSIAAQYFNFWHKQGVEFLIDATNAYQRGSLKNAAFYLHQAAESFYYSVLLVFTEYKPKAHNLKKLRKKAKHISEDFYLLFNVESNKNDKHLFELLKRSYIDARYHINFEILVEEVGTLRDYILRMETKAKELCSAKIAHLVQ